MSAIAPIAVHAFKEAARGKALHALAAFALLTIGASFVIRHIAAGQDVKIIKDLGLASAAFCGLFVAVFGGAGLLAGELERGSIHTLLAKPVRRHEVVLGKYAGLALALGVNVAGSALVLYGILACVSILDGAEVERAREIPAVDPALLTAYFLLFVQLLVVTALALLLSTFSSPALAAAMTVGLYVSGHFNADLRALGELVGPGLTASLAAGVSFVLPSLAPFDITAEVVHAQPVPPGYVALATVTGLAYVVLLLLGAACIFSRRDLT